MIIKMGKAAVPGLIAEMKTNDNWQIQKALGTIGDPSAVQPLIEKLEMSFGSPLNEVTVEALEQLTKRKMGNDPDVWREYWNTTPKAWRVRWNEIEQIKNKHFSFSIKTAHFQRMNTDPQGNTVISGMVHLEFANMIINAAEARIDNKNGKLTATGEPVKIDNGETTATSHSEARKLTYDLKTKTILMEGEASIIQDKNGQKTKLGPADTIKIEYPAGSGKNGEPMPKVTMYNAP